VHYCLVFARGLWPQGEVEDLRRVLDALEADLKAQFKADTAVEMHALVQVRPCLSPYLGPYLSPYLRPYGRDHRAGPSLPKPLSKLLWP
jgi:hypothetical protein